MFKMRISMILLKTVVNASLIFIIATALSTNENSKNVLRTKINYRLPDSIVPTHYNIKLIPYIEEDNFTFNGESNININIHRATRNISLHALNLTLNEEATTLTGSDDVTYIPTSHNYDNKTNILTINFVNELPLGYSILNLKFIGVLNDQLQGFFRVSYINQKGDKQWVAATYFEATSARLAFPCWDEPALKATFNISIKHHRNYTALSNMPIREKSNDGNKNDTVWTYFDMTPPMSTYLVAFVVTDYVRVPNVDGTINMWCRPTLAPSSKFVQEIAQKAKQLLMQYTNSSYKVPKMDHVALPQSPIEAMENWGLIIYAETSFAHHEELDSTAHKERVAVVAVHEMAHQWFGNVVSPVWWSYLWLNEGFASYFQEYILNQIFEDWRMMDLFVVRVQQSALQADIALNMKPITAEVNTPLEIQSLFSFTNYGKAPAILRMLQHIITDDVFRKGIISYIHTHEFSSATPDDLYKALQTALDESDVPHNAYRLKEVMDTWVEQRHYPLVTVTRNYETGETILMQEHFRPQVRSNDEHKVDDDKWWIPLSFTTQMNPDFSNTLPSHWLKQEDHNVTIDGIDPNAWIIVNLQQMGYYRVNYDLLNWRKIANYLNSDEYVKIHVLNRAQIIDDAIHLLLSSQLRIDMFLDIARYLSRETDYIPWYPMFRIFRFARNFFELPNTAFLKLYILEILDGLIKHVGYEENINEDNFAKYKRIEALTWACTFGHSECKRMATIKLNKYLENPEVHKFSPNLKTWLYCYGIMEANISTWNKLMDIYTKKAEDKILDYLTCSEDSDIIINYLNMSLINDSMTEKQFYIIYDSIVYRHAAKSILIDYILTNLKETISRKMDINRALASLITNIYSEKQLDKISEFVKNNFNEERILTNAQRDIEMRLFILRDKFVMFQEIINQN